MLWCVVLRKTYNILKYLKRKTSADPGLLQATPRQHDLRLGVVGSHLDTTRVTRSHHESQGHFTSHWTVPRTLSVPPTPTDLRLPLLPLDAPISPTNSQCTSHSHGSHWSLPLFQGSHSSHVLLQSTVCMAGPGVIDVAPSGG